MKRKIIMRSLLGIVLGISINSIINIMISLIWANGYYSPCVPMMIEQFGNEIHAVVVQTLLSALLGAVYGGASVIWEIDRISIAKQTGLYMFILASTLFPVSYITYWMEHSYLGFLEYVVIFFLIFIVIWVIQYFIWKRKVDCINHYIHKS